MESSQDFFLEDFQKKLKEHPKCSYRENKEETDGMKELPKNFPSPSLNCFSTTSASKMSCFPELWHSLEIKISKYLSEGQANLYLNYLPLFELVTLFHTVSESC